MDSKLKRELADAYEALLGTTEAITARSVYRAVEDKHTFLDLCEQNLTYTQRNVWAELLCKQWSVVDIINAWAGQYDCTKTPPLTIIQTAMAGYPYGHWIDDIEEAKKLEDYLSEEENNEEIGRDYDKQRG
jgi:hypothetical protein